MLGSVSPTEETLFVGKSGVNKSLARVKAAVVNKRLAPPVTNAVA